MRYKINLKLHPLILSKDVLINVMGRRINDLKIIACNFAKQKTIISAFWWITFPVFEVKKGSPGFIIKKS